MNRFHEAAYSLDLAIKYAEGESKFTNTANVWKHKINQKLENKPFDVNFITISEIPGIQPSKSLSIPKAGPTIAATPAPATPATPASEDVKNTVPAVEKLRLFHHLNLLRHPSLHQLLSLIRSSLTGTRTPTESIFPFCQECPQGQSLY